MKNQKFSAAPRQLLCLMLSAFLLLALAVPAFAAVGYYLTWDEYRDARGVDQWNYNDQAAVIAEVANHAVDLYAAGEKDEAHEYAKTTYWGYYEVSGFERNTMNYISGSRVSEVELAFTTLRKAIKKDQGTEAARAAADDLIEKLVTDGAILSPEGAAVSAPSGEARSKYAFACLTARGDTEGCRLAERFQARLSENQMKVRQIDPTLLASRADAGLFDVVIVSTEMADALTLSTAYGRAGTLLVNVRGDRT